MVGGGIFVKVSFHVIILLLHLPCPTLTRQCLHDLPRFPSIPRHKDCHCLFVHRHCPIWFNVGWQPHRTNRVLMLMTWEISDQSESSHSKILEKIVLLQLQPHLWANNLLEIRQSDYRKSLSQHWNCCFECPRRSPYKVWSETCVNTCTVGSERHFRHSWQCHPVKTTREHFWNLGNIEHCPDLSHIEEMRRSLLWLTVWYQYKYPFFGVFLGDRSSDLCYSLCTHNLWLLSYPVTAVVITSTLMTQKSLTAHHPVISLMLSPTFSPV